MIRVKSLAPLFRVPGFEFKPSWQACETTPEFFEMLARHAGLHVAIHPDDVSLLPALGYVLDGGKLVAAPVAAPVASVVVESAATVANVAKEAAAPIVRDDGPRVRKKF